MSILALADMKVYLGIATGTTGDDSLITTFLSAAQKSIESYCHRSFESSSGVRYYRAEDIIVLPTGSQYRAPGYIGSNYGYSWDRVWQYADRNYGHTVLWVGGDLLSISTLLNGDGTTVTSTEYWLEPRNQPPYQYIRLRTAGSWIFDTDGEVSVDGTWGYSTAAPADIVQACYEYTAYLYHGKDAAVYDVTANPELGIITVPKGMPTHVKVLLEKGGYVRQLQGIV